MGDTWKTPDGVTNELVKTWEPGDRVWIEDEQSFGTVVVDEGELIRGVRVRRLEADFGVTVKLDSDGDEVRAAHAQLVRAEEGPNGGTN